MIGLIVEDKSDADAVTVLIHRILLAKSLGWDKEKGPYPGRRKPGGVKYRSGKGCSGIDQKGGAWMHDLATRGATHVILVRDCDRNPANGALNCHVGIRSHLKKQCVPKGVERLICIPVEEIEAWWWSCPAALKIVARKDCDKQAMSNPNKKRRPKEALFRLSEGANRKPRYSQNDNLNVAGALNLDLCAKRCPSFKEFREFVWKYAMAHSPV